MVVVLGQRRFGARTTEISFTALAPHLYGPCPDDGSFATPALPPPLPSVGLKDRPPSRQRQNSASSQCDPTLPTGCEAAPTLPSKMAARTQVLYEYHHLLFLCLSSHWRKQQQTKSLTIPRV